MEERNAIILGSGPAGLTAAIYLARAEYKPLVVEGVPSGGQLMITTDIENFPGFPDGISGPELIGRMHKQAEKFGTEFLMDNVNEIDLTKYPFELKTGEKEFSAKSVIICTGAKAKYLDLPSVQALSGKGISACATCDGFFFKDKIIFVIGGGDTAAEEALYLTRFGKEVNVVHRRDELRASKYMANQLLNHPKINIIWDTVVEDIKDVEKGRVESIVLKNVKTGEIDEREAGGIFMGIGHAPATSLFTGQLDMDEHGYLKTEGCVNTKIEGVFAAGDVADPIFRQGVSASGTGCMAGIAADRFLEKLKAEK